MKRTPKQLGAGMEQRRSRTSPGRFMFRGEWLCLAGFLLSFCGGTGAADEASLRISVYATAGDVMQYLASPDQRGLVLDALRPLRVSHVFLEGRRGDEYVPPQVLRETRDFLATNGIRASGGIATVPGAEFGPPPRRAIWVGLTGRTRKLVPVLPDFFTRKCPDFRRTHCG